MPPSQEPAGHRYALPAGSRIGDYRIEGFLGAGSFGITYLATDERLGRRVAVKEYLPSDWAIRDTDGLVAAKTQSDEEDLRWGLDRFAEEARSLARFDHPNVVRVHRYFTAHATGFLVMEYVDGGSLGEMLRRKGTLSETEIERHVLPVLDGLEQLHEAGLLHRDIKPDNVALRADGSPVLADFGAARQEVGGWSRALTSLVTPRYSPPEQYSTNAKQGPATDLYAFAAVLHRCVTDHPPLDAADRSLGEEQPTVGEAAKGAYSAGLLAAIDAALSFKPQDRPQSAAELRRLLAGRKPQQPVQPTFSNDIAVDRRSVPPKDGQALRNTPRVEHRARRNPQEDRTAGKAVTRDGSPSSRNESGSWVNEVDIRRLEPEDFISLSEDITGRLLHNAATTIARVDVAVLRAIGSRLWLYLFGLWLDLGDAGPFVRIVALLTFLAAVSTPLMSVLPVGIGLGWMTILSLGLCIISMFLVGEERHWLGLGLLVCGSVVLLLGLAELL